MVSFSVLTQIKLQVGWLCVAVCRCRCRCCVPLWLCRCGCGCAEVVVVVCVRCGVVWCGVWCDTLKKKNRVYVHNVPVCTSTTPICMKHVGVVPVHTGTF